MYKNYLLFCHNLLKYLFVFYFTQIFDIILQKKRHKVSDGMEDLLRNMLPEKALVGTGLQIGNMCFQTVMISISNVT